MAAKKSRPTLVAPMIPLWGVLAFYGVDLLHGTRYLYVFVVVMLILLATLFTYVANQALQARRTRAKRQG